MHLFSSKITRWVLLLAVCAGCQKEIASEPAFVATTPTLVAGDDSLRQDSSILPPADSFVTYRILPGEQYCVNNNYLPYMAAAMHFTVQFDSSAAYTNAIASNQFDYNKLFGFSDNMSDHHSFSARFGWRWCHETVELSAYTYNDGVRSIKDLGGIDLNRPHDCAIIVNGSQYDFVLDGDTTSVPRTSLTPNAIGYKLLPYFGGDEVAPHAITIKIKETS